MKGADLAAKILQMEKVKQVFTFPDDSALGCLEIN
jgi:thiamine pyrophosphate-dependent acetolactate synthase large subunit-like protein